MLPDIQRVTQIKILGITVKDHLSISEHVRDVICKCGQCLHARKVVCSRGMCNDALRHTYRTVVLAKLLYASPAWWGFATSSDKQNIEASVKVFGSASMATVTLHRLNSLRTPTKVYLKASGTTSITSCNSSFQTTTATELQSSTSTSQLHLRPQKLTIVTL